MDKWLSHQFVEKYGTYGYLKLTLIEDYNKIVKWETRLAENKVVLFPIYIRVWACSVLRLLAIKHDLIFDESLYKKVIRS